MTNDTAINRQAAMSNEAVRIEQALREQPQLGKDARIKLIATGSFGDLAVEFWGVIDRGDVDLWDVALAGTTVSLSSVIDSKKWDSLLADAQAAYDMGRSPYGVAA